MNENLGTKGNPLDSRNIDDVTIAKINGAVTSNNYDSIQ